MAYRILLADDHRIFREGLRSLLGDIPAVEVVAETENGRSTVQAVGVYKPDVVLMDIGMPDLNGIEATRQIKHMFPQTKIVGLSMHVDEHFVGEMLRAGADGYLSKKCNSDELAQAIKAVSSGQSYISPAVAAGLVEGYIRNPTPEDTAFSELTDREREVLQLVAEERTVKEIASMLHLSPKTVHAHREHVMTKLGIFTVAGLTKYALRHRLTEL
jgi:two-component system, NarL family, response regulator NreC